MKIRTTTTSLILENSIRIDGSFHASPGMTALDSLMKWPESKLNRLADLCLPGGIFIGGRSKRIYVRDSLHGIPFLSSSDMLLPSFETANLVSRSFQPDLKNLILREGWILISRSGTVGNVSYTRKDMDGLAGSEHIMRVVIDPEKIHPGYVYAFLSNPIGQSLTKLGTFGSVIDTISPEFIAKLPIPRPDNRSVEKQIHELIEHASTLRSDANLQLLEVENIFYNAVLGVDVTKLKWKFYGENSLAIDQADFPSEKNRLDAFYYIGYVKESLQILSKLKTKKVSTKKAGYEIFSPPIFKRIPAKSGFPYMSAIEFYNLRPTTSRFLSKSTPNADQYLVKNGMILLQKSGQRYGLLGRPLLVTDRLSGVAVTSDVVRVVHSDLLENGYFYAFANSEFGRRLILRCSYGTSIPHLNVPDLISLEIPWPESSIRNSIGKIVIDALGKRELANQVEDKAQEILMNALVSN